MSNNEQKGRNEWEKLWNEYSGSLENWRRIFDEVLKANSEMQTKFSAVVEKASKESNLETMKQFGDSWQKAMTDAGIKSVKEFGDSWQKAAGLPDGGFRQFAESWQRSMSDGGMEQMRAYGEMMKKFAETWNTMWPRK